MSKEIKIFKNEEFGEVRTLLINDEPYFVGKDVASALGYNLTGKHVASEYIKKYCDEEDYVLFDKNSPLLQGSVLDYKILGQRGGYLINESGLYSLVFESPLPTAKKFKRWITSEVLPTIRKTGGYIQDNRELEFIESYFPYLPEQTKKDMVVGIINKKNELQAENNKLKAINEENKPKVALAESITNSDDLILVGDMAKILKQNGINIGQNRLFSWLRDNNYLCSRKGDNWNMPTQYSMELGLFRVVERTVLDGENGIKIVKTPKVTGKGQQYFINKFKNS